MKIKKIDYQQTWNIRHQVMWPNKPINYIKLTNDNEGLHYGLFVNNEIVSIVSVFIENNNAQFRKFATLQNEQGNGYGSTLLKHVFSELTQLNVSKIWCNARIDKTSFYEKFGMIKTKKRFEKGGIDYVIMEVIIIN